MRSISSNKVESLNPSIKPKAVAEASKEDILVEAIRQFPKQLSAAIKAIPSPVIAQPEKGAWIIDVKRDKDGKMNQMIANFHQTKTK